MYNHKLLRIHILELYHMYKRNVILQISTIVIESHKSTEIYVLISEIFIVNFEVKY